MVIGWVAVTAQIADPVKWTTSIEKLTTTEAELQLTATIEPGWAMYAIDIPEGPVRPVPTSFSFIYNAAFELENGIVQVTKPEVKNDATFNMKVGQFRNLAVFRQKIKILKPENFVVKGQVEYMCCNENSCLPPVQIDFEFKINPPKSEQTNGVEGVPTLQTVENSPLAAVSPTINDTLLKEPNAETNISSATHPMKETSSSLWVFFLMALSAGFLSVLTPCVYPIIPMTVSFFMRDGKKRSTGITKALIFGLSIILIYTLVGVVVALTKRADIVNQIVANWLTNLIFAVIFIAFALSFFGLFEITLPSSLANKLDQKADKGGYVSAFFMALALVVISFSCTGPFVGGILVSSAQGLAIKPIIGMFGFSVAFALPFTLLALFPSLMKKCLNQEDG